MIFKKTIDKIDEGLQSWLESIVPYTVVKSGQNTVRPKPPFVSYKMITGMIKLGSFDELYVNKTDNLYHLKGQRQFTVLFEATGTPTDGTLASIVRATDIIGEIQFALNKPNTTSFFLGLDLAIQEENEITDITELLETEYEPRATLSIIFRTAIDEEVDPGTIETVLISGDVDTTFDGNYNLPIDEFSVSKP